MTVPFRLLHRFMGVCLAAPLLLLVMTGVPLQFTVWLHLGSTGVPFSWVHDVYGIAAPQNAFNSGPVTQVGNLLLVADATEKVAGELLGVDAIGPVILVATTRELLLVSPQPDVPAEIMALPAPASRAGVIGQGVLVMDTSNGMVRSGDFGVTWSNASGEDQADVRWLQVRTTPVSQEHALRFGAANLTWERWLQDLHSGRFFGPVGVWLMNLASFVFILLGFTGLVLWYSSRRTRTVRSRRD